MFTHLDLNTLWFVLVGVLFTGYAVLDGFDLGVGALHLFARSDQDRRILLNAIGPVWDGNEVWLVTGGGALFAAFPMVYATVFSGFYLPFMLLLVALIFRAVAIEFRSKQPMRWWRQMWDVAFAAGSVLAAFLIGVTMGNIAWGIPLDPHHEFAGTLGGLVLHPYALLMGVTTVALFAMHGAIYLVMKTEGELHDRIRRWITPAMILFILCYVIFTLATLLYVPHITEAIKHEPWFFVVVVLAVLAVANIPRSITRRRDFEAFLSSCGAMLCLMALFGIGM
jgi:cytochrome d ubiquinol oxidase subunit II